MRRFFIVTVCIVFGGFLFYASRGLLTRGSTSEDPVSFFIPKGAGLPRIAKIVEENNLAQSAMLFRLSVIVRGHASALKPGRYDLPGSISLGSLIDALRRGPRDIVFTITPGQSVREVDAGLASVALAARGDLLRFDTGRLPEKYSWLRNAAAKNILEGFLAPDTYHFYPGESLNDIVDAILGNFERKVLPRIANRDTIIRTVTIASLLEKEVRSPYEGRIVAGIFARRLAAGVALQVDATVLYARCGQYVECLLTKRDYARESPYNTYMNRELPPGPIASPSLAAIEAAQDPAVSDYWYYLTDPKTKNAVFAKTFDEHQKNRVTYLLR
ncbi:endolytic transglycosylase MltG [Candidatus Wolfebacteria bacterium]|nr:endolytic transglycosylase MltG [Candidatus Wolfebacteria bacterium]